MQKNRAIIPVNTVIVNQEVLQLL